MIYMLDTNMVSYIAKRQSMAARERLYALEGQQSVTISAVSAGEIRYGLAKKPQATTLRRLIETFLSGVQIVPWGDIESEIYGELRAASERRNKTLGRLDMMIAAHAVSAHATLVTKDKSFSMLPELTRIENWATDL